MKEFPCFAPELDMRTSLQGRLDNTPLPYKEGLMAVKEAVVNAIQAIDLADVRDGHVIVTIHRIQNRQINGIEAENGGVIDSVTIEDNGVGFTDKNFDSFQCLDYSEKREKFGCKGMGRLMWLKAFTHAQIDSAFWDGDELKTRKFEFAVSRDGNDVTEPKESDLSWKGAGTRVKLCNFRAEYEKQSKKRFDAICNDIFSHCIRYFAVGAPVSVVVKEENGSEKNLDSILRENTNDRKESKFNIGDWEFTANLILVKSGIPVNSGIFWCANGRVARVDKKIFRKHPIFDNALSDGQKFLCIVQSAYLDNNVRPEREGFTIPENHSKDDSKAELFQMPSFEEMTEALWPCAEEFLRHLLDKAEAENKQALERAFEEFPQFSPLRTLGNAIVIPPDATRLDQKKILRNARAEMEDRVDRDIERASQKVDIEDGWQAVEELQKAIMSDSAVAAKAMDLASYVARRKSVLKCFEKALGYRGDGKYNTEATLHSLIVPMRVDSLTKNLLDSNLWLLDDRLAFHNYLASDLPFEDWRHFAGLEGDKNRPDVAVFKNFWADAPKESLDKAVPFVAGEDPHGELTIVEFKRPGRTDKECIEQIKSYVNRLSGKGTDLVTFYGRPVRTRDKVEAYAILDISKEFEKFLEDDDFALVSNGHFYRFYNKLGAVVHVLTFDKMLELAKQRNAAFFRKLGID